MRLCVILRGKAGYYESPKLRNHVRYGCNINTRNIERLMSMYPYLPVHPTTRGASTRRRRVGRRRRMIFSNFELMVGDRY